MGKYKDIIIRVASIMMAVGSSLCATYQMKSTVKKEVAKQNEENNKEED